ncbi:MAG: TonB-dependent receptor [Bacteroidetes bacterium]|nr:TonB-dependent receptor [Bacteroidota bacterium]
MLNFESSVLRVIIIFIILLSASPEVWAQGFVKGIVSDKETGTSLSGVRVQLAHGGKIVKGTYTKPDGSFSLSAAAGKYKISFSSVGRKRADSVIAIQDGETATMNTALESEVARLENITVYGAARREQKLTDAPAAISTIMPDDLRRATAHGQIGKTLEHIQGVDVVQSGMNDFNINTRGFNNSINRRMLVLLDGRDPSMPLLNLVEWNSFQTDMADIKSLEVVRGPGSALYGANAYNGVINISTYSPRDVIGTRVSVTGGEYGTFRASMRHAGETVENWSYKVNVGYSRQNQDWIVSRQKDTAKPNFGLEYPGISFDVPGLRQGIGYIGNIDSLVEARRVAYNAFGTLRLDYNFTDDERILAEGGFSKYGNEYFVNQTGRVLVPEANKPFVRIAYSAPRWNVQAQWAQRITVIPQVVLNAAATSAEGSTVGSLEIQRNDAFLNDDLKIIAGASHEIQNANTTVAGALSMIAPDDQRHNFTGIYGQAEYNLLENLQLVGAARLDLSSYFDTQFSPKGAIVYTPIENQTFRLTVNRSFLRPSYGDRFRRSPGGLPIELARIDSAVSAQTGAPALGLGRVPVWNLGNPNIGVETAESFEFGYKGIINKDLFVTLDVYVNRRKNFISNPLGGLAPEVYRPIRYASAAANDSLRSIIGQANFDRLAQYNDPVTGKTAPAFIITPTNIGLVEEKGVELGVNYYALKNLLLTGNFAYLESQVLENIAPTNKIIPNVSPRRYNIAAQYTMPDWDATLSFRYVDGFAWIVGLSEGHIPSYGVLNFNANYRFSNNLQLGVNVFNLLDRKHYEIFGGTYLYRYATASATYSF